MQIQVNTDRNIDGHEAFAEHVSSSVTHALSRFSAQLTRVEVHLSDENSNKKGGNDDLRCMIEARLAGHDPIAVSDHGANRQQALTGATDKLVRALDSTLGRLRDVPRRAELSSED